MILYFDGVCNLCNFLVNFLIKRDPKQKFFFSTLQSDYAKQHLDEEHTKQLNTLVLVRKDLVYIKSDAVLLALSELGGLWVILALIGMGIPRIIRNTLYDVVSGFRLKVFGIRDSCRLPSKEEQGLFLVSDQK